MINQKLQVFSFYILLFLVATIVFYMWTPFFTEIFFGGFLAILFYPTYSKILKVFKNEILASIISIVLILLIVFVPLIIIGLLSFNEIADLIQSSSKNFNVFEQSVIIHLPKEIQNVGSNLILNIHEKIADLSSYAFSYLSGLVTNLLNLVLSSFLVFFSCFYFLKDGTKIKKYLTSIFPLSQNKEDIIISRVEKAITGVIKGTFIIAIIQGVVGTIGYLVFGLPGAILFGILTVLAALVPNFGTALIWIPGVLFLYFNGNTASAFGLLLWSMFLTGTVDNLVSPKILSSNTQIHPLLVLFGVLGGLQFFGIIGVILGPIVIAVFVTLLELYKTDLASYLRK